MVGLARLTAYTTLEEVQASMMTGLRWATRDGAGKMCIPSLSRYEYPPTTLTSFFISDSSLSLETCHDLCMTLYHVYSSSPFGWYLNFPRILAALDLTS